MKQSVYFILSDSLAKLFKERFFIITLVATVLASIFFRPHLAAIQWNVIAILFSQMLVCLAFEDCHLLTSLAEVTLNTFTTPKKLGLAMVIFTGGLAMLVTNDIALLTVVPLTIKMAKITGKDPYMLVILETISANIFSAVTPFGNPQNLYLFSYYHILAGEFFFIMLPFCILGAVLLCISTIVLNKGEAYKVKKQKLNIRNKKLLYFSILIFALNILAVLRVIDYKISLLSAVLIYLIFAPRLFKKVDYILLTTFALFFLFTDSMISLTPVQNLFDIVLGSRLNVLLVSAAVSQIISNVPAAVLLSGFTPYYRELIYGVSAGGLGTLIASLASLISYKLYIREFAAKNYLKTFFILNFMFLLMILGGLLLI